MRSGAGRLLAALAVALLLGASSGCARRDAVQAELTAAASEARHELGRKVWNFRCYFCHGYSGDARTLAATYLDPPPRDFTRVAPGALAPAALRTSIAQGRPNSAMKGFAGILSPAEIDAVAAFVQREFIEQRAENTRYHTAANGWPDHERHRDAFAFARGELALDTPWERLDPAQQRGKRLFLSACISCHDRARVEQPGEPWQTRALSYPRDAYCTSCHDSPAGPSQRGERAHAAALPVVPASSSTTAPATTSGAAPAATYRVHDTPPALPQLDARERRGEALYQRNCAFCHAADGTAGSWIGRFLEPHPRDLTDPTAMREMTRERLTRAIADGLDGSSMPAWKSVLEPAEIDAVVAYIHRAFHPVRGM